MEIHFVIDSDYLSPEALLIKHRLETDPSSRISHMEYLPGMEIIESVIRSKVMEHLDSYDYSSYTGRD
ncbi:2-iminoacetate synthase ThiH, partial [Coprococcus eutactus]|nr:2-iminoacetate synthase ThiH [Coprococcus eutactus]